MNFLTKIKDIYIVSSKFIWCPDDFYMQSESYSTLDMGQSRAGFYLFPWVSTRFTSFKFSLILIMNTKSSPQDLNTVESRRDIFCRLATSRVEKVSYALDILSKLSSRRSDYTEEDIKNIKKFLQSELDKALTAFTPANETNKKTFVLKA